MDNITLIGRREAVLTNDIANMIQAQLGVVVNKIHPDDFLAGKFNADDKFLITYVTDPVRRKEIVDMIDANGLSRATFVHSSAIIDPTSVIESGTFVGPFCIIAYQSVVHQDCLIAPYTLVSHRAKIGQGTVTNPGAMIAGAVNVGQYCLLGIRSTTVDQIDICDNVQVGPCAFITKTITEPGRYLGSPARRG